MGETVHTTTKALLALGVYPSHAHSKPTPLSIHPPPPSLFSRDILKCFAVPAHSLARSILYTFACCAVVPPNPPPSSLPVCLLGYMLCDIHIQNPIKYYLPAKYSSLLSFPIMIFHTSCIGHSLTRSIIHTLLLPLHQEPHQMSTRSAVDTWAS